MKRVGALGCLATVVFDAFWLANQGLVAEDYSSSPCDCLGVVLQLNKCCRNLEMNATRCFFCQSNTYKTNHQIPRKPPLNMNEHPMNVNTLNSTCFIRSTDDLNRPQCSMVLEYLPNI